ncbi:MAG: MarR family transcriptional regulator [Deltaproteobacteria bacterium]|nr:MarR family transcriptional regulator [Deltaproteobacteria bacterium]
MLYNTAYPNRIKDIVFSIRKLTQAEEGYNRHLENKYDISASQLFCILALYEDGPLPPSRIAKRIMVNTSSVTGIIDRLEVKHLVERTRISHDRRIITISLTEAGKRLAETANSEMKNEFMIILRRFDSDDVERIISAVNGLVDLIHSENLKIKEATTAS